MDVLDVRSGAHDGALGGCGSGMMDPHGSGGGPGIVSPGHGSGGCGVPVGRLGHLAARGEVPVRTRHVPQAGGVHPGALKAAGVEPGGGRLVQIRVVHRE